MPFQACTSKVLKEKTKILAMCEHIGTHKHNAYYKYINFRSQLKTYMFARHL